MHDYAERRHVRITSRLPACHPIVPKDPAKEDRQTLSILSCKGRAALHYCTPTSPRTRRSSVAKLGRQKHNFPPASLTKLIAGLIEGKCRKTSHWEATKATTPSKHGYKMELARST